MRLRHIIFICAVCFSMLSFSQEPIASAYNIKLDGVLKAKYEHAYKTNNSRFTVRNSRLGISGMVTPYTTYRAQVELSDNGKFNVLDLYGAFSPTEALVIKLGQSGIPVHNSFITNPSKMLFANRAFIGKYITQGTRDIGISASYDFKINTLPIGLDAAIFNGSTINDPVWTNTPSYAARIRLKDLKRISSSLKTYKLPKDDEINYLIYGFDVQYVSDNWRIDTEIMHRENKADDIKTISSYVQGAYWFPLNNSKLFKNVITASRWDMIGDNTVGDYFDVNRLTLGVGLSFENSPFESLIRLDYELHFIKNDMPAIFLTDEMSSNKLSLELVLTF